MEVWAWDPDLATPSSCFLPSPPGTERQSCSWAHVPAPGQPAQWAGGRTRVSTRGACTPPGVPQEALGDPYEVTQTSRPASPVFSGYDTKSTATKAKISR